MSQNLDAALALTRRGWRVFPIHYMSDGVCSCGKRDCKSPGKHPLTAQGFKDASVDEMEVRKHWSDAPSANIGVATGAISGIVVLDIDPRHGGDASLARLESEQHPIPQTVEAITGGGGRHLIFAAPAEVIRSNAGKLAEGIDVRADGGYIVVPPSNHASGGLYCWRAGRSPDEVESAPLPAWLLTLIVPRRRADAQGSSQPQSERIPEGQRNSQLASIAGSMRRRGLGADEIKAALMVVNLRRCDPPLDEAEVYQIAISVARYDLSERVPPTDMGNAQRLVIRHGHDLRYCFPWKHWVVWDGRRWSRDQTGEIYRRAKDTVRAIFEEAARLDGEEAKKIAAHAIHSQRRERIEAMIKLAQAELAIPPDWFDQFEFKLNIENGTLNLRTGELRPHRREEFFTRLAPVTYDSEAGCPLWCDFLRQVMNGDVELIDFIQRLLGYCMTGETSEQCLFLFYGTGANGKTTLLEAVGSLLGDEYAKKTEFSTLLSKERDRVSNDIAALRGARVVSAVEVERNRRLNESLIKELTGGDTISARFLYGEFFQFKPEFKLLLAANNKPEIRGVDEGIWRRVYLVPFTVTIPLEKRDKTLLDRLRNELPGILNWALEGCLKWRRFGLRPPPGVIAATDAYRDEMDVIGDFIDAFLVNDPEGFVPAGALREAYEQWSRQNGLDEMRGRTLQGMMRERGYRSDTKRVHGKPTKVWLGCARSSEWKY